MRQQTLDELALDAVCRLEGEFVSEPGANRLDELGLETRSVLTRADLDRAYAVNPVTL